MTARWTTVLLMATIGLQGEAQSLSQRRFPLSAQQVSEAITRDLSGRGVSIEPQKVLLNARVVATEAHPMLDVSSVESVAGRISSGRSEAGSLVKLTCHVAATCLPFYAVVSWPAGMGEGVNNALNASVSVERAASKPATEIVMRAGAHATLLLDDDRAHIQVSVISLENGVAGHRIHVATPDHRQIYVAEIVSATVLRGSF